MHKWFIHSSPVDSQFNVWHPVISRIKFNSIFGSSLPISALFCIKLRSITILLEQFNTVRLVVQLLYTSHSIAEWEWEVYERDIKRESVVTNVQPLLCFAGPICMSSCTKIAWAHAKMGTNFNRRSNHLNIYACRLYSTVRADAHILYSRLLMNDGNKTFHICFFPTTYLRNCVRCSRVCSRDAILAPLFIYLRPNREILSHAHSPISHAHAQNSLTQQQK